MLLISIFHHVQIQKEIDNEFTPSLLTDEGKKTPKIPEIIVGDKNITEILTSDASLDSEKYPLTLIQKHLPFINVNIIQILALIEYLCTHNFTSDEIQSITSERIFTVLNKNQEKVGFSIVWDIVDEILHIIKIK